MMLLTARSKSYLFLILPETSLLKTRESIKTGWQRTRKKPFPLFEAALGRAGGAGMAAASSDGALLGQEEN